MWRVTCARYLDRDGVLSLQPLRELIWPLHLLPVLSITPLPPAPSPPSLDACVSPPSAMFRRQLGTLGLVFLVMSATPSVRTPVMKGLG